MYTFDWYAENVIRLKFVGDVEGGEVAEANEKLLGYYEEATEPILVIIDGLESGSLPTNIQSVNARSRQVLSHSNAKGYIFVGFDFNPIIKFVINVVANLNKSNYDFYDNYGKVDRRLSQLGVEVAGQQENEA